MVQHGSEPIQITEAGKSALQEELEYLKNVRRAEVSDWVMSAREGVKGDLADAAELAQAQREQEIVETRIADLSRILDEAQVVGRPLSKGVVALGSTVTVRDDDGIDELTIVGPVEVAFKVGRISAESPVGRALMGRKAGETIEVETPAGRRSVEILKVA
jgi:transcription elongation factor GreA